MVVIIHNVYKIKGAPHINGGVEGTCKQTLRVQGTPTLDQNFLIIMQFLDTIGQIIDWGSP